MKTILALTDDPEFAEALQKALSAHSCRIITPSTLEAVRPLLEHGLAEACVVDVDAGSDRDLDLLAKLCRQTGRCSIIVYANRPSPEWEGEAYLKGVTHVLSKPLRGTVLAALLERIWQAADAARLPQMPLPSPQPQSVHLPVGPAEAQYMPVLRSFSRILTHSLNTPEILRDFVQLLHDMFKISRAVIFLREPPPPGDVPGLGHAQRLTAARAIGIAPALLQFLELSTESGLGGQVFRFGRILHCCAEEALRDAATQREFDLLGAEVAVPVTDGESVIGLAALGRRITGELVPNSELELIFHVLQQLGLALKNIRLHEEIVSNREMMAGILSELSSACVVIRADLAIVHFNKSASKYFQSAAPRNHRFDFSDIPSELGIKIHQVLASGAAICGFRYEPTDSPGTVLNIHIVPFQRRRSDPPDSVLLTVEDISQSERLRRLEVEAVNLRLVKTMAYRLTNEIANAILSVNAHQQLLAERGDDPDFRHSLDSALADSTRRIGRLIEQMRFLALEGDILQQEFPIVPLLQDAFQLACKHQPSANAQFQCTAPTVPIILRGNRAAIKLALSEIFINALQADPEPRITVRVKAATNGSSTQGVQIEVEDNGSGFTPEIARTATEPFFTTRIVGSGLGLTVSRAIIESHGGKLELVPADQGRGGLVRVRLPFTPP